MTQDSIGHLKTFCMSVLSLVVELESEWKRYSSSQSNKKMLAFEYEFSLTPVFGLDDITKLLGYCFAVFSNDLILYPFDKYLESFKIMKLFWILKFMRACVV